MAKFTRHDPRNKKKNRNKMNTLSKDLKRIRNTDKTQRDMHYEKVQTSEDTVGV